MNDAVSNARPGQKIPFDCTGCGSGRVRRAQCRFSPLRITNERRRAVVVSEHNRTSSADYQGACRSESKFSNIRLRVFTIRDCLRRKHYSDQRGTPDVSREHNVFLMGSISKTTQASPWVPSSTTLSIQPSTVPRNQHSPVSPRTVAYHHVPSQKSFRMKVPELIASGSGTARTIAGPVSSNKCTKSSRRRVLTGCLYNSQSTGTKIADDTIFLRLTRLPLLSLEMELRYPVTATLCSTEEMNPSVG